MDASTLVGETEYQRSFVQAAEDLGWIPHHTPDSRKSSGNGFPDLVLRHDTMPPYVAVFELKTMTGRVRKGQPLWIKAFRLAGIPAAILRLPRDWDIGMRILTGGAGNDRVQRLPE